eukprot:UN11707
MKMYKSCVKILPRISVDYDENFLMKMNCDIFENVTSNIC